jgi:hypothetical protein
MLHMNFLSRGAGMKVLEAEQTFLRISWEAARPGDGEVVAFEATLCRHHRQEIWHRYSNPRGCRQFGYSCDLCEGRTPISVLT